MGPRKEVSLSNIVEEKRQPVASKARNRYPQLTVQPIPDKQASPNLKTTKQKLRVNTNVARKDRSDAQNYRDGPARNTDGTLKDAAAMDWDNSPSDENQGIPPPKRKSLERDSEPEDDIPRSKRPAKKPRVSTSSSRGSEDAEETGEMTPTDVDNDEPRDKDISNEDENDSESDMDEDEKDYWATMEEQVTVQGKKWTKPKRKAAATADLRLVFKKGTQKRRGKKVAGHYCQICLNVRSSKTDSFMTGNVSAQRTHITRKHYDEYVALCTEKGIKASPVVVAGYLQR